ncbi:hypothetical protein BDQ94DRAFT_140752 [Aspergillus welwitschiae]|uniref:Uncharacterized protein n=1 Tax=Aspergillus welwitschiae TaxID=1341132 RepID=A0A3F3Q6M8_9EURO|nr:hypothetical protein BDQ94DRAFT_140752 [Aspergillus welwitschiae]RDH34697.1 hypothetical protein BDQ94DRAFT_140752 [Aspergillus welwitschiae]
MICSIIGTPISTLCYQGWTYPSSLSLSSSPSALLLFLFSSHPDLQLFLSYSVTYYQPLFNFSFLSGLWSLSGFGSSYTSIIVLDKISLSVGRASLSTGPPSYVSHGTSHLKSTERINEHVLSVLRLCPFDVLARGLPNLPCITIQLRLAPLGRYLTWDGRATSTHQLLSDPL